jgi:DNA topoisomerase-1
MNKFHSLNVNLFQKTLKKKNNLDFKNKTIKNNFNKKKFWTYKKNINNNKVIYIIDGKQISSCKSPLFERLNKLYIPPAYQDVIIAKSPNNKIQAIGVDTKGRKQYIYHPKYIQKQIQKKYNNIINLGNKIIKIEKDNRKEINNIITNSRVNFPSDYIPIILLLLLKYHFRIGSQKYEKDNNSFGITTLKKEHIKFLNKNDRFAIEFIGKKGILNKIEDTNKSIYSILKMLVNQDNNDEHLFCYLIKDYKNNSYFVKKYIDADDVKDYLKKRYNANITPKMFRTWYANYHLLSYLKDISKNDPLLISNKMTKKQINTLVKNSSTYVSHKLNNTPTISKKAYIDPEILNSVLNNPAKFIHNIPDKKEDIHLYLTKIFSN